MSGLKKLRYKLKQSTCYGNISIEGVFCKYLLAGPIQCNAIIGCPLLCHCRDCVFERIMDEYMVLKRICLALLITAIVCMIYTAFSLEKKEILELEHNGDSAYFTKYCYKGFDILAVKQSGSAFKVQILCVTAKKLMLIGTLKCNEREYAAAAFQDRINLYTPAGELKAQYKPEDKEAEIISCCISDIDGDSNEELLVVEGDGKAFYGHKLVMLSFGNGLEKLYEREFEELNPWKVQTCDVDGDHRREIALGVYKEAAFHPVMAKRPFIYNWDKGDIVPMWRGSRLSRPFDDYIFFDIDADEKDEIIAIERLSDGKALINAYKWAGFGFESIVESLPYEDILQLVRQRGDREILVVQIKEGDQLPWIELENMNGQLVEKAEFNNIIIKK